MEGNFSESFRVREFVESPTAKAKGIDNTPPPSVMKNLAHLAQDVLQPIREEYGHPIIITSGYRCPELNAAVGGSKTSQHMAGEAADIRCNATTLATLFRTIERMIKMGRLQVGQLIWEYGTREEPRWIHVSLPRKNGKPNNQIIYLYSK